VCEKMVEKKERACEEECESESNPKPRPQPKLSSADVAERGVALIGVRSSGNLQGKEAALTHTNGVFLIYIYGVFLIYIYGVFLIYIYIRR